MLFAVMNFDCALAMDMRSYEPCSEVFYWSGFPPVPFSLLWGSQSSKHRTGHNAMELCGGKVDEEAEGGLKQIC